MDEVDGKKARNLAVLYWKKSKDVTWEMFRTSLLDVSYAIRPEYDHNVNVMKGFLDWEMWDDNLSGYIAGLYSSDFFVSNNNVVKARIWANGALLSAHDLIYQYQYDGDGYPIQISTESRIIFYEYE